MSHVCEIDIEVTDLNVLRSAAERLGCELVEAKTYKWYGRHVGDYPIPEGFKKEDLGKCDYVIRVKGAGPKTYEVGVVKKGKTLKFLWDFYAGGYGLVEKIGKGAGLLKQACGIEAAKKAAKRRGMKVKEKTLKDGQIQLVCTE